MFKLHCDRCGVFLKDVTNLSHAKDLIQTGSVVCKPCKKTEENLIKTAERMKRAWESKIDALVAEFRAELTRSLEQKNQDE